MHQSSSSRIKSPVNKKIAKVPVVMQMEALECGAASLAMVLAYYGKWVPLEKVRYDCGVSRDGSSAKNIVLAARNYGLKAAGYKCEPHQLKNNAKFPCIVFWEFNHFIVLCGIKGDKVYVNDPARGNYRMTMEEFDKGFTGVCLMFEPTPAFEPGGKKRSMVGYAMERLKGAGSMVAFMAVVTVIAALLAFLTPGFSRVFMDYLLTDKAPQWASYFFAGLSILIILQLFVAYLQALYGLRIDGKLAVCGNTSYLWKVLHLPMEFFSQRFSGDIQMRQSGNASIASALVNVFAPLFIKTVMMVIYLVVMVRYSLTLSIIGVASILINTLVSNHISKKRVNLSRVRMRDESLLYNSTLSGIKMIETIKSSGSENGFFEKWSGYQANVNSANVKSERIENSLGIVPEFVSTITNLVILFIGVYLTVQGDYTVGKIMAFQGFLQAFTEPAMSLINAGQSLQEMRTQMERIEDVMSYPSEINEEDNELSEEVEYNKLTGSVEVKNVTFGYSRLAEPLIRDFNLKLNPGQSVALVGASGCGKSTIAKLISGLNKPWDGEILFDDKPIGSINRRVLTGSIAVVDQDITMFADSIAENIKMWDHTIEDFEMIMAAKDAQIHDAIAMRDGGYRSKLLEEGKNLSGGERQRLELARVLAMDPTILILDEATSALDAKTEHDIVKAVKDRGITCIVIAHRLSTVRNCDEIIVMDHGNIVERGSHSDLYEKGGLYTKLETNE